MFSAKKFQGKKLYELARQGEVIERRLSEVEIYEIKLLTIDGKLSTIKLFIKCSTGTYIRTLAHDLGQKLGCGAVLWELKRIAIGPFSIKQSNNLRELEKDWEKYLIKPEIVLNKINKFKF